MLYPVIYTLRARSPMRRRVGEERLKDCSNMQSGGTYGRPRAWKLFKTEACLPFQCKVYLIERLPAVELNFQPPVWRLAPPFCQTQLPAIGDAATTVPTCLCICKRIMLEMTSVYQNSSSPNNPSCTTLASTLERERRCADESVLPPNLNHHSAPAVILLLQPAKPVFLATPAVDFFCCSVFAFSHEQFVLPRVATREGDEGVRLTRLVLTFVYAAGDIVRIRSDPECESTVVVAFGY